MRGSGDGGAVSAVRVRRSSSPNVQVSRVSMKSLARAVTGAVSTSTSARATRCMAAFSGSVLVGVLGARRHARLVHRRGLSARDEVRGTARLEDPGGIDEGDGAQGPGQEVDDLPRVLARVELGDRAVAHDEEAGPVAPVE